MAISTTPRHMARSGRSRKLCLFIAMFTSILVDINLPKAVAEQPLPPKQAVRATTDILYYEMPKDPDRDRHRLDVYRPVGKGPFPILILVHGGAWVSASKDEVFGIYGYGTIGRRLAERGVVVVMPNYRLSPGVRHPEHIKDVARAFDWTCRNAADYGGDPKQIYVGGHSAGGHLAALLATDETWLKQVGRSTKEIRGVLGLSGVYRVDDFDKTFTAAYASGLLKVNLDIRPSALVFGEDPEVVKQASPYNHVRAGLPPFLLLNAGLDYPALRKQTKDFAAALKKNQCEVEEQVIPWRTHETLVFDIANLSAEPACVEAVVKFIQKHKSE